MEMAEAIHSYISDQLPEAEYQDLSDNGRNEIETGYSYKGEDFEFEFSLAGTVNSDPEILDEGLRKIVFHADKQTEVYRDAVKEIERLTGVEAERKFYGEYEFEELRLERSRFRSV